LIKKQDEVHKFSWVNILCGTELLQRKETGDKYTNVTRPNILWIVAENIDLDLGCYGALNGSTPNLDALVNSESRSISS